MKKFDVIAAALVIVGALNWGLAGVFHVDLVAALFGMRFGETSALSAVVYCLVGIAGLYQALSWKSIQRRWHAVPPVHRHGGAELGRDAWRDKRRTPASRRA